jgi:uncharacterized protein (DUF697 family)
MSSEATATAEPVAAPSPSDPERALKADIVIKNHMLAACAGSIVPVPLLDLAAVTAVQVNMIRKLAAMYGKTFSESPVRNTIVALVGGVGGPWAGAVVGISLAKLIPVVGWAAGVVAMPAVVGASTYAIGHVFLRHFQEGGSIYDISTEKVRGYYKEQFAKGKTVAAEPAPSGNAA